jgi:O-antigen/teichoic acid export membrane protein
MSTPLTGFGPTGSSTGSIFAAQTVNSVLRVVYAAVLARALGPELFGLMNYGLGWYAAFLAVANLQLESYMSREVAIHPEQASRILSRAVTLRVTSTSLVLVAALVSAATAGHDSLLTRLLLIYAVAMAARSAAMWCTSAFISHESARQVFKIEVSFRIVEVLVGLLALLLGGGVITIALIHTLSWVGQATYGFWLVRRHLPAVHLLGRLRDQAALFRVVLPMAIASIGATWLMQGPFLLFKNEAATPGDVGVVALVLQIFVLVTGLPIALGRAALPALSRTVARSDLKEALFLGLVLRAAIPGTTVLVLVSATFGSEVMPLIFGTAYRSAGVHLAGGAMLVLPFGVATIANQILIAHGKAWQAAASAALGAVSMTGFVLFLMPSGGRITDYLLSLMGGMSVWAALSLTWLSRQVPVKWGRYVVWPMVVSAVCLGLYDGLADVTSAGAALAAALLVLVAGLRVFNIVDRQERATLSRAVRAGLQRARRFNS